MPKQEWVNSPENWKDQLKQQIEFTTEHMESLGQHLKSLSVDSMELEDVKRFSKELTMLNTDLDEALENFGNNEERK